MVHFILVFCLIWIAIEAMTWLADHPGAFWFWTISGFVIGGMVWLYNSDTRLIPQTIPLPPWFAWALLGALGLFGVWRLIAAGLAVFGGKKSKHPLQLESNKAPRKRKR